VATPGVVFSMRFVQASVAVGNYSGFAVGYLSRPEAFEKEKHENDVLYHDDNPKYDQFSYMDDGDKTDGLFDAKHDLVNDYGKFLYKNIFDESQEKDCPPVPGCYLL